MANAKPRLGSLKVPPRVAPWLFVALAWIAALVVGWFGLDQYRAEGTQVRVIAARDRLISEISALPHDEQQKLAGVLQAAEVVGAASEGRYDVAAQRIGRRWPDAVASEVYSPGLDEAYSGDLAGFGYGKLALLNRAAQESGVVFDLDSGRNGAELALAGALRDGPALVGLAYLRLPWPQLEAMVRERTPSGGYLAVRSGDRVLAQAGPEGLAPRAESEPVAGTTLRIAAAAVEPTRVLPFGAGIHIGAALLLILLGAWLFIIARRGPAKDVGPAEPTFAQQLKEEPAVKPAPAPKTAPEPKPAPPPLAVDRSIFRAYDIRGIVGKTLDAGVAQLVGRAIGSELRDRDLREIVIGRDGRLSGPMLSEALIQGLREAGCDVIDIGQAATPLVYFATHHLRTGSGVAVTGSHNPPDYNGFKIVLGGETLSGDAITALYERIAEGRLRSETLGGLQVMSVDDEYVARIAGDIQVERRLKVVCDAGNGIPGAVAPRVLEAIGCDVVPLYCDVDGEFPNHHPDPSDPENLRDLITSVQRLNADLGVAFDGDGDRLGVVTRQGDIIYPDRLLMLFAQDVLMRNPGASIIYDVKCTGHLAAHVLRHGGSPIMWKTGHSLIKAKMRETEAELAGEMSGHFFFKERWYGFDDGIYSAARLLEILAADEREPQAIFDELPHSVSTPELKIPMEEGQPYAFIDRFKAQARLDGAKVATIDGLRADWPDGWGLVRASNTTPVLVLRFDADSPEALRRIQDLFREQLLAVDKSLKLPF